MMPAYYKDWYDQSSRLYNKCRSTLKYAYYSDNTMAFCADLDGDTVEINHTDLTNLSCALTLWHGMMMDFGVSGVVAARFLGKVLNWYLDKLDIMFADLKELTKHVRLLADWDVILANGYTPLVEILCWFPQWRREATQFKAVHGLINHLYKVTFNRGSLERQALADYRAGEDMISLAYSDEGEYYLDEIEEYFYRWTEGWEPPSEEDCCLSSGSTADVGNSLPDKILCITHADLSAYFPNLQATPPEDTYVFRAAEPKSYFYTGIPPSSMSCKPNKYGFGKRPKKILYDSHLRFCHLTFVPKTALKKRTIGMERAVINFLQNGLDKSIRRMPNFPRQYIDFSDQAKSQQAAIAGSGSGKLATVDFSAASDSVTIHLLRRILRRRPEFLWWLEETRSPVAVYKAQRTSKPTFIWLDKFAAMGSVVCFTIESMVFLSIALLACKLAGCKALVWVYGDDVILPVEAYPIFKRICEALFFKLNEDKSFAHGPFREACGVFAFDGVDVTIPSYPRKQFDLFQSSTEAVELGEEDFATYTRASQLGNQYFLAGLDYCRYLCIRKLVNDGVSFLSGLPEYAEASWPVLPERGQRRNELSLQTPSTPLYCFSYESSIRCRHNDAWLDQPSDLRIKKDIVLTRISQSHDSGLPEPYISRTRCHLVDYRSKGYKVHAPVVDKETCTKYSDEERYLMWLYAASHHERKSLLPREVFPLNPLREPCLIPTFRGERTVPRLKEVIL
jgi:hypothetical protein